MYMCYKQYCCIIFHFLIGITLFILKKTFNEIFTYFLTYLLTYLLNYLLHGAESFLRS